MNDNMMLLLSNLNSKDIKMLLRLITAEMQRERLLSNVQELTLTELQLMKKHIAMRLAYIWTFKVFPRLESEVYLYQKLGGSEDDFVGGDSIETIST